MSFTIVSALRWWMRDQPQAVALNIDGAAVSYGELYDWTRGVAARLMEAGVKPGDRVGILATQALEYYALAIGMQFVGAVVVPLNIRFTERELRTAVEDTTPVLLFADADRWVVAQKTVEGSGLRLRKLSDVTGWRDPPADEIPHHAEGGDLVAIMSTSGSTAKPKFVKFTHAMVVSVALELQLIEPTVRKCRALLFAPPFSGGLYCVYEYLVLGGSVFLQSRFDPKAALDTILD